MRSTAAILFLAATSAWADDKPLTWEPARIVQVEEAVASGVLAPTDPHPAFFDFFSDAVPESDGSVIFIANGAGHGVPRLGREGVYAIDRDGRPSVLVQRGDKVGNRSAAVVSISSLEMRGVVPVARCLLDDGSEEVFEFETNQADRINATTSGARGESAAILEDARTIRWKNSKGSAQIVADLNTRIPELFGGTFTSFGDCVVAFDSWVIFTGSAKDYEGLFAMNMETSRLFLLLDNCTSLGTRHIEDFQISKSPRAGEDVAVTVTFADDGSGIYLFRFSDGAGKPLFGS